MLAPARITGDRIAIPPPPALFMNSGLCCISRNLTKPDREAGSNPVGDAKLQQQLRSNSQPSAIFGDSVGTITVEISDASAIPDAQGFA